MPETTENYHRIPVSSGHDDHKIRTITISEEDGIKALYCVDDKETITYLFDKDKWTMEEAENWVEEHKEDSMDIDNKLDAGRHKVSRKQKDFISSQVRYKSNGDLRVKDLSAGEGEPELLVRGFFTDDKQDQVGDIITKEATRKAIEKWRKWGNIRTMHDYPSGRVEAIGEMDGLDWNEIVTVPVDKGTIDLLKGNVLKAYSVGIIPREYEINEDAMDDDFDGWFLPLIIHDYDLIEISYVDHPANYSAAISDVSSGKSIDEHRTVLFKMMPGDDSKMEKTNETEKVLDEEELFDTEPEEYMKELLGDEFKGLEGEDDEDDDEVVELGLEDVLLAVAALGDKVDYMFNFITSDLVEMINGPSEEKEMEEETDEEEAEPQESEQDEEEVEFDEEAFAEKVAERVAELLKSVNVSRQTSVSVEKEGDEQEEPLNAVEITRKYMNLSSTERRRAMKEVIEG